VTTRLAQREIMLAGVALLGAVIALALVTGRSKSDETLPRPVGAWYPALAGVRSAGGYGKRTACGQILRADTNGVSHPVLPCGAKIFVSYGGKAILTQVIDRGPYVPGRVLDLTETLAAKLGVTGVQRIRWAYASPS
jgi:rare lipoprotein A (peptidoglycan hydrolase)